MIRLILLSGGAIWINPQHVVAIRGASEAEGEGSTLVECVNGSYVVRGGHAYIAGKLHGRYD